ncbi:MAG: large conductance mechanosensitive channel protein MscL [Clostridia bacterium]|nr:large conductance mechanosensitive channel protein MscL [Clostridia bacterium]
MKKIFQEFKAFITRGNVVDLAVGMIVGAAFTAIVTALVNNIFKPLINAIPMEGVEGLITMLVPRNSEGVKVAMDSTAIDLSQSVYIDWGAFIMAIVNFLLTAVVLFSLVKVINKFRDGMGGMKNRAELIASLTNEEKATCKNAMLPSRKELKAIVAEREAKAAEEAAKEAEEAAKAEAEKETMEDILRDIRDSLKK